MMFTILAGTTPVDRLNGIRDRLSTGGSAGDFLGVIGLFAAGLVALYAITRIRQYYIGRAGRHPGLLFHDVLKALPLGVPQRDMLLDMARDLRLPQPTVLLLSPQVFRTHANRWMSVTRRANDATRRRIEELAGVLFPTPKAPHAVPKHVAACRGKGRPAPF